MIHVLKGERQRETKTDTQQRRPLEDRGRGWNYAATSQGTPRAAGRGEKIFSLDLSEGVWSISGFWTFDLQNCERTGFCCFKP